MVGEYFFGKYTALTTSGTTGTPGTFMWDDRTMRVVNALAFRMLSSWLNVWDFTRILVGRGRMSMVMGTGGHFASAVAAARLRRRRGKHMQALSVHMSLPELVAQLNRFRPVVLAPYASMARLLASEQEAGRLHIKPVLMVLSAEGLPGGEYDRIAKAFNTKVGNSYAATECPFLSYSCAHGWLHVNSDWVLLEAVDANHQPTAPGVQSHTVLISNLANRVQPILRYDIGDSVLERPNPCPCGNPLLAIRVQGRTGDLLTFPNQHGERISIAPLALEVDDLPGVELVQIVQNTLTSLRVRLLPAGSADTDRVWASVHSKITRTLAHQDLEMSRSSAPRNHLSSPPAGNTARLSHYVEVGEPRYDVGVTALKAEFAPVSGIQDITFDMLNGRVTVLYSESEVSLEALKAAVAKTEMRAE